MSLTDNNREVANYFSRNALAWISDAYEQYGYNYPTPYHRVRVVRDILKRLNGVRRLIDVGCGGGQLAVAVAEDGLTVCGVDQSEEMLRSASELVSRQNEAVQQRVSFSRTSLHDVNETGFDTFTAMGVIGYLSSDAELLNVANKCLRNGGYAIVSFRNRLFNLFSLSHRTQREIADGNFDWLLEESAALQQRVSDQDTKQFLECLKDISTKLLAEQPTHAIPTDSPSASKGHSYVGEYEARQSTPMQVRRTAEECGFEPLEFIGVHPHFAVPGLNNLLPPQVYNRLCDSLIPLERSPMSLLWSSVFIGVFQKKPAS